jgi:hypothetical protein
MTADSNIKFFESPLTGRQVAMNLHASDYVWLHEPTSEQVLEVIGEHERIAISEAWKHWSRTREGADDYIEAFHSQKDSPTKLRYFSNTELGKAIGYGQPMGRGLGAHLRQMSLKKQRQLLEHHMPTTRGGMEKIASPVAIKESIGTVDMKAEFLQLGPRNFLRSLVERSGMPEQELLTMLRARGWVLYSRAILSRASSHKWVPLRNPRYGGTLTVLLGEVGDILRNRRTEKFGLVSILTSSITEVGDMSPEWMDEVEAQGEAWLQEVNSKKDRGDSALPLGRSFRVLWNHRYPEHQLPYKVSQKRRPFRKTDGTFEWIAQEREELRPWVAPLAAFVTQRPSNSKTAVVNLLNHFCHFLIQLPSPPKAPEFMDRRLHVHDVTLQNKATLMQWLATTSLPANRRTALMNRLREFLEWHVDWLHANGRRDVAETIINPVGTQDQFRDNGGAGQTFRTALPSWLLKELRATLTDDDFAFVRVDGARTTHVRVVDNETGKVVKVWWPGTAVALLTLLELPLRSHQVRWLDSGVLDEMTVDTRTGKSVKNKHPGAIIGRRESCLRMLNDSLRLETWCGLFVNTNKTALYDGRGPIGYEIPYLPPALLDQLVRMRDWGKRYLPPLTKPVLYSESSEARANYPGAVDKKRLPLVAPLFADPFANDKRIPANYHKLVRTYVDLLAETEKRVKAKYNVDLSLTETKVDSKGKEYTTWRYDLHTLRVSGISAMLENGVPLEVVSQFVAGHASLVMTLWYYKNSPGKIREIIAKHRDSAEAEGDFIGSKAFAENIEQMSSFLLTKDSGYRGDGQDTAFEALKAHSGLWTISTDGICPGTSCSSGGELIANGQYGAVPGGRRCGLCRYWITGPAFILGQTAAANNLVYQIRRKGQELARTRDRLIDETDAGHHTKARQTRHHIEALERELTIDLTEWQARYAYAMASSQLLDDYIAARQHLSSDRKLPAPLLTASSAAELTVTLQEVDEFVLLDHVTQMVDFLPGFKNREAIHEQHLVLSKVLEANELPQFLLHLDAEKAEVAANMMSSVILEYVRGQDLPRVLSGELRLADVPVLADKVGQLIHAAAPMLAAQPTPGRRFIPIVGA